MPCFALGDAAAAHVFLRDLAVVLCVAAVTTVVFQRLKQPVVLGYLLAGIIVGPHTPGASVRDATQLGELSELGMILVLFSIGLEFSLRRLAELGPRPAFIAALQGGIMLWLGFLAGRMMGLDWRASVFVGGIVAISSTVLIQRVFLEARVEKPLQEMVLGVLVYEDIVGILMIAGLTTLTLGGAVDPGAMALTGGKLLLFLGVVVVVGLLVVPRAVRFVVGLRRNETLVIASLGLCFALALAAQHQGYSTALGAFLAGSLIAESGHGHLVHQRTQSVADVFAAVFFVSIGMQIDPALLAEHWVAILVLTLVTIFGKLFGTALGAFLVGAERRVALRAGISMAQIGEFAFIIAGIGVASGTIPDWIAAAAVGVSTVTAFVTPYFIARSDSLASAIDRALPVRLQNYAALYTSWIADIRAAGPRSERSVAVRRAMRIVVIDALLLAAIVVAGTILASEIGEAVEARTHVGSKLAFALVVGAVAAVCVPFVVGIVRGSRALAQNLAEIAMPSVPATHFDPARAPRAALVAGLQFGVLACVILALTAVIAPFLPRFVAPVVVVVALLPFAWFLWRAAQNLEGHLRAGAEIVAEAIARASPKPGVEPLEEVQELLPGLGDITMIGLKEGDPGVGHTLAELDVRSLTGANVIVLQRGARRITMPNGDERLEAGDVLALTGSHDAIEAAGPLLSRAAADTPTERVS
jgi:CPA2 family monovalent cation:H+ antiporter-2